MVGYQDIAGYGSGLNSVGGAMTPAAMGFGASNPVGSYLQGAAPSMGSSGIGLGNNGIYGLGAPNPGITPPPKGAGASDSGLGWNLNTAQLALGGIQTIGSLWQAWEANKLAKEKFKFQKDFANTNLANQIQSYNTTLEDRTRARSHTEGGSAEDAQAYIEKNKLSR